MNDAVSLDELGRQYLDLHERMGHAPPAVVVPLVLAMLKEGRNRVVDTLGLTPAVADHVVTLMEAPAALPRERRKPLPPAHVGQALTFLAWLKNPEVVEVAYRRAWQRKNPATALLPEKAANLRMIPLLRDRTAPFAGISLDTADNRFVFWCAYNAPPDIRRLNQGHVATYRSYLELRDHLLAKSGDPRSPKSIDVYVGNARRLAGDLTAFLPEYESGRYRTWERWRARGMGTSKGIDTFQGMATRLDSYVIPFFAGQDLGVEDLTPARIEEFLDFAQRARLGHETMGALRVAAEDFYLAAVPLRLQGRLPAPIREPVSIAEASRLLLAELDEPRKSALSRGTTVKALGELAATRWQEGSQDGAFLSRQRFLQAAGVPREDIPQALLDSVRMWTNPADDRENVRGVSLSDRGIAVLDALHAVATPPDPILPSEARRELGTALLGLQEQLAGRTTRMSVLEAVMANDGPIVVSDLAARVSMDEKALWYHTRELTRAGVLTHGTMASHGPSWSYDLTPGLRAAHAAVRVFPADQHHLLAELVGQPAWTKLQPKVALTALSATESASARLAGLVSGNPPFLTGPGARLVQAISDASQERAAHMRAIAVADLCTTLRGDRVLESLFLLADAANRQRGWVYRSQLGLPSSFLSSPYAWLVQVEGAGVRLEPAGGRRLIEALRAFAAERVAPGQRHIERSRRLQ